MTGLCLKNVWAIPSWIETTGWQFKVSTRGKLSKDKISSDYSYLTWEYNFYNLTLQNEEYITRERENYDFNRDINHIPLGIDRKIKNSHKRCYLYPFCCCKAMIKKETKIW